MLASRMGTVSSSAGRGREDNALKHNSDNNESIPDCLFPLINNKKMA